MDGPQKERDLVNELEEQGYGAMRAGASGGGTSSPRPDIFFRAGDHYVAGEMKSTVDDYAYIEEEKLEELEEFCDLWNAIPVAITRWSHDTNFYVLPLARTGEEMMTDGGNLSLKRAEKGRYTELSQYIRLLERS